ncbi:MAG: MBL fold metallo-hydrolase [Oscillospiraceae bacterium]|nr:MBL fold metallo-hydrolase [Oscillospiraceae bacterium]
MAKLFYQGHGSFRLTADDGTVIFIDPFLGEGYDKSADIILITHQHDDHRQTDLITQKPDCTIISNFEALEGGKHNTFNLHGIEIEAVEAGYNDNHTPEDSVGYIIKIDGLKLYFCGDTSKTPQMSEFAAKGLDYAFLCADGIYNMGLEEAAECARLIGAKHNVPVHLKPGELFDMEMAERFDAPNRLIIVPGKDTELN